MGNSNAHAYGKIAAFQWYLEGSRYYGQAGYQDKLCTKRASWRPTPSKTMLEPYYFNLRAAEVRLALPPKVSDIANSPLHGTPSLHSVRQAFEGAEGDDEKMRQVMAASLKAAIEEHKRFLTTSYRKRIIVTGANRGLGYTTALALARLGAEVHLVCRSAQRGNEAKRMIVAALVDDLHRSAQAYMGEYPNPTFTESSPCDFLSYFFPKPVCVAIPDLVHHFKSKYSSSTAADEYVRSLLSKEEFTNELAPLLEDRIVVHECDVSDFGSVRLFAGRYLREYGRLDVLIHNAGVMLEKYTYAVDSSKVPKVSRDDPKNTPETSEMSMAPKPGAHNEATMATMLGGTMLLTELLLPALSAAYWESIKAAEERGLMGAASRRDSSRYLAAQHGARVINVASGGLYSVGSPEGDLQFSWCDPSGGSKLVPDEKQKASSKPPKFDGTLLYAFTKRAQVILTEMWPTKLRERVLEVASSSASGTEEPKCDEGLLAISFHSNHPGWVATEGVATAMPDFFEKNKNSLRSEMQGSDTTAFLASASGEQLITLHSAFEKHNGVKDIPFPLLQANQQSDPSSQSQTLPPAAAVSQGLFWFDREPAGKHKPLGGTHSSKESDSRLWAQSREFCGLSPDMISLKSVA